MNKEFLVMALVTFLVMNIANADTLSAVKGKGFVQCGVNTGLPGFSTADEKRGMERPGCGFMPSCCGCRFR